MNTQIARKTISEKKVRLIEAAVRLILRQGFSATSVDDICAQAKVTKGSFFYYFASKEEICFAAMDAWSGYWHGMVEESGIGEIEDPLDRLEALFRFMESAYLTPNIDPGCVVGTVAQECSLPNEKFKEVCAAHLERWKVNVSALLSDAKATHTPVTDFDPDELAWWLCTFVQGTMLICKTQPDRSIVSSNIKHCRSYVLSLFGEKVKAA